MSFCTSDECSYHLSGPEEGRRASWSHSSCWFVLGSVSSHIPAALISYTPHNSLLYNRTHPHPTFFQLSQLLVPELFHQPTLMHNFLYSLTICLLHSALNQCTVQTFTESEGTRCCVITIFLPEDGHVNARNMSGIIV